jgi:hypothetical protein
MAALVNVVINLYIPYNVGNLWSGSATAGFSWTRVHGVGRTVITESAESSMFYSLSYKSICI